MLKKIKDAYPVIFVIAIAAILRLYILLISNNCYKADPISKVLTTLRWLRNMTLIPDSGDWLPLHFYIMGLGLKIYNNPFFTPRFISLIFCVAGLVVFYKLIKLVFDRKTAFLSLCVLIFYPIHIVCSVVSLSEIIFLFFLLSSFYFFFTHTLTHKSRPLFISAVFLALAGITRHEAWIFILFIPFLLWHEKDKKWPLMILFFVITIALPLLWWVSYFKMNAFTFKHGTVSAFLLSQDYGLAKRVIHWQGLLYDFFGVMAYLMAVAGLSFSLRGDKPIKYYSAVFSCLLLFFIYGTAIMYVSADNTYSISFGTLMIPLSIYGLDKMTGRLRFKDVAMFIFITATILTLIKGIVVPGCTSDVYLVSDYLKYHANRSDKVLVDHYWLGPESYYILLSSGLPYDNVTLLHFETSKDILGYIEKSNPRYIIRSKHGAITRDVMDRISLRLTNVLAGDVYTVYQLTED